jgi:ABC-type polar amino acid transport system ATPase subunit
MKSALTIDDLRFAYGEGDVLRGVSLSVPAGEICAVIGQSGSGKTSLIKCLLMLERPTSGRVSYGDIAVNLAQQEELGRQKVAALRKRIGYVPQNSLLLPHLTALRNVMLPLIQAHKQREADAAQAAQAALAQLEMQDLGDRPPWRLSGGQQQRVAIARAMAIRPMFFFLDEPTAALDASTSHIVADVLRTDIQQRGASAVIVTHNLGFARRACDSIALLASGRIEWHLRTAEVELESALRELA